MRKKTGSCTKYFILPLFLALIMFLGGVSVSAAVELAKVIDKSNCAQYKDLLIPALYRAVERGDFVLHTAPKLNYEYKHSKKFLEAGEKNAGKFDVNAKGDLIDKKTGKIPFYNIYGRPFPHLDSKDPKYADKIMYNFQWIKYRIMAERYQNRVTWIDNKVGEHRYLLMDSYELFMTGHPPGHEVAEKDNPNHYIKMSISLNLEPYDMFGTNQLIFDYMDHRDVTTYAYVPSIRRVRQTSGVVRSDPFFGSDAWQDLGFMWDGKNIWMDWKVIEEKTILCPFSQVDLRHTTEDPDGTYHFNYAPIKIGFQDPNWKGAKWALLNIVWVPRTVYVIEQTPRDPYYAWGKHTNYMDKETECIFMKEMEDKSGAFRTWSIAVYTKTVTPSGQDNVGIRDIQMTIDEKARHATAGWAQNDTPEKSSMYMPESRMSPKMFTKEFIMRMSK